jgi:hypothetical protein
MRRGGAARDLPVPLVFTSERIHMKKMRLNPDQLAVESFRTADEDQGPRGTVQAREDTSYAPGCEDDSMARCTEGCVFPQSFFGGCDNRDAQETVAPYCNA